MTERVLREREARIFIRRIVVENFKSIRRIEMDLKPGINLLIGPNASGKTNILEAIYFLYKALGEGIRSPYMPHIPEYWDPIDILYRRDTSNTLKYTIELEHYIIPIEDEEIYVFYPSIHIEFSIAPDRSTLIPVKIEYRFGNHTIITLTNSYIESRIKHDLFETLSTKVPNLRIIGRRGVRKDDYIVIRYGLRSEQWQMFLIAPTISIRYSYSEPLIFAGSLYTYINRRPIPFIFKLAKSTIKEVRGVRARDILDPFMSYRNIFRNILLLKHPDIGALRNLKPFMQSERLDPRATNLASVLFALIGKRGRIPERIDYALSRLFPETFIRIESKFGQVALMAEESGVVLPPPNLADGLFKILSILTAVELNPSILLIDEIENSMHAEMLEYIVDELDALPIPVIVATHSPVVADLVAPDKIYIVSREPETGTVVECLEDPEKIRDKLKKLGVSLSDYIFYSKTRR